MPTSASPANAPGARVPGRARRSDLRPGAGRVGEGARPRREPVAPLRQLYVAMVLTCEDARPEVAGPRRARRPPRGRGDVAREPPGAGFALVARPVRALAGTLAVH
ncbi:hypothetical protein Skr01_60370 [Sphaerisporangium krabiense]|nr:hypothetical protein Skr01_60370 [Sphaerisporangium krabiense]